MPRPDGHVQRQIRTLFESGRVGGLTDGQLLERFATGSGDAAERSFALLVERHGPMVLRVCRGLLADPNDAHDAFQAVFLVLLRRSRGLWVRDSLGPWLHQVALRTASRARAALARRRRHERAAAERNATAATSDPPPPERDWEPILHHEINRLPDRQRLVVVLCDLQGQTQHQAARVLGWPVGTVKSRLARARSRLRDRLVRRGLAPAATLAAYLAASRVRAEVPAALTRGTLALFTNLARAGTVPVVVAHLARGVLTTMFLVRYRLLAASVLAGAAALGAGLIAAGSGAPGPRAAHAAQKPSTNADVPLLEATTGPLSFDIAERGTLEAATTPSLVNPLEASTTILSIVPEGTRVKKGDLVCELDAAALRRQLLDQELAVNQAYSTHQVARLARRMAEQALDEYVEGSFRQQRQALHGEAQTARDTIKRAEDRVQRLKEVGKKLDAILQDPAPDLAPADLLSGLDLADRLDDAEQALADATLALGQAELKLNGLEKYTRAREITQRKVEIERAKLQEMSLEQALDLQVARAETLRAQVAATKLHAPNDGLVVYVDAGQQLGYSTIEEGATVVSGQAIVQITDLTSLGVNAKVKEAYVDQVAPGQPVQVRIDAFPDRVFKGEVETVAPRPDPMSFSTRNVKVYTTRVRIDDPIPELRPGMSAQVEIHVADRERVVRVPVKAIATYDRHHYVAVKAPDGGFAWRPVTLGLRAGDLIEIREGLEAGELVAADPGAVLTTPPTSP